MVLYDGNAVSQFRAEKGALPEAGDMEQAEAVFGLAKACNEEDGGFKAEGLDDSKVRRLSWHVPCIMHHGVCVCRGLRVINIGFLIFH